MRMVADYNKFSRITVSGSTFTEEAEDVVLDNATIAAGAPVKINSATYTAPV